MTVLEIVQKYLTENGFDGLYNKFCECSCLSADLAPCPFFPFDCKPGYRAPCDCGENHEFHIVGEKP